jgi:hypothetical protein
MTKLPSTFFATFNVGIAFLSHDYEKDSEKASIAIMDALMAAVIEVFSVSLQDTTDYGVDGGATSSFS